MDVIHVSSSTAAVYCIRHWLTHPFLQFVLIFIITCKIIDIIRKSRVIQNRIIHKKASFRHRNLILKNLIISIYFTHTKSKTTVKNVSVSLLLNRSNSVGSRALWPSTVWLKKRTPNLKMVSRLRIQT